MIYLIIALLMLAEATWGQSKPTEIPAPSTILPVMKKVYTCPAGYDMETWEIDKTNTAINAVFPPPPRPMKYQKSSTAILEDINPDPDDKHPPRCVIKSLPIPIHREGK